jgi:chromosome segregation ATPase
MKSLKDAEIDVESERAKLRVAEAQNKELKRDLSIEKELIEQLQGELDNERASLEQAIQEKSFLQEELDRESTKFGEMHNLLRAKELELVEARLEVQQLKFELASLQLILDERSLELSSAGKKLKQVNEEIFELKSLMNSREEQFMQARSMLKEKEEHMQSMQNDLCDKEKEVSEAESVVERIVELTNKLVVSIEDKEYGGLDLDNEMESKSLSSLSNKPSADFKWGKKQLETELEFTRESLRTKEMEILAAERAVIVKDEELKMVQGRLDARDSELKKLKEEMVQDAHELRKLYALAQERIGERTMGDLAIEKLELEAAELEVEAATSALQKLVKMSQELLGKASLSFELDSDSEVFVHDKDDDLGVSVVNSECIGELTKEVARVSAFTDRLVKEADIIVDAN